MSEIRRVAVIGAGTMGHGIAHVCAFAGYDVAIIDADRERLERGLLQMRAAADRAVARGKATASERAAALARVRLEGTVAAAVVGVQLVIEAVPERIETKREVFRDAESHAPPNAILATNTSSLSVTEMARTLRDPSRMVGMHFFNPVPAMRLVEIVRGERTSEETIDAARRFAESLGKTAIVVRDSPGFATSRLGVVLGLEAIRMLEQGVASAEDIDRAMELGYNHPMGPLRLTDVVGLDVRLAIAEHLHDTLGDETYEPPALLRDMVREGKLGKKTGHGFYRWEGEA